PSTCTVAQWSVSTVAATSPWRTTSVSASSCASTHCSVAGAPPPAAGSSLVQSRTDVGVGSNDATPHENGALAGWARGGRARERTTGAAVAAPSPARKRRRSTSGTRPRYEAVARRRGLLG